MSVLLDGEYGQHDVYVNEGSVNSVREMTITCYPSTKIDIGEATA